MTTIFVGSKKNKSTLSLTKANVFPDNLYLLSNPLLTNKIQIEKSTSDGDLNKLLSTSASSSIASTSFSAASTSSATPTFSSPTFSSPISSKRKISDNLDDLDNKQIKKIKKDINKYERNIKKLDLGYIIPLDVDSNIKKLSKLSVKKDHYKIEKKDKNYFIYQLVNNELYVLISVLRAFFDDKKEKEILFNDLSESLNHITKNFEDGIKSLLKSNKRNTYTLYGGCFTMEGHPNYTYPSQDEKFCHIVEFIIDNSKNFKKPKDFYNAFQNSKPFNKMVDIKENHFKTLIDSGHLKFYSYLKNTLFPLVTKLESLVAKLIQCRFPELYSSFNIDIPHIETKLSLFKSFAINIGLQKDEKNKIRQGTTNKHKDVNDCLYTFCIVVVFGEFEGGDLILSEIGITMEIQGGYIVLLRSSLLEHFNSMVLEGKRFSIVFYLRKFIFNEI